MSIDTVFKPSAPTALVTNSGAVQVLPAGQSVAGIASFRVRNLAAVVQYFGWGPVAANVNATAPATPGPGNGTNVIGMLPTSVESFEFPPGTFFLASSATGFEFTPGQGS